MRKTKCRGGDWKELYQAVESGNYDLVQYHVKNGINLNYQHPEILMTLLVTAIKLQENKIALFMLENGADPELESYYDQLTPLQAALKSKNFEVLAKLKTMNIKISWLQNLNGVTLKANKQILAFEPLVCSMTRVHNHAVVTTTGHFEREARVLIRHKEELRPPGRRPDQRQTEGRKVSGADFP